MFGLNELYLDTTFAAEALEDIDQELHTTMTPEDSSIAAESQRSGGTSSSSILQRCVKWFPSSSSSNNRDGRGGDNDNSNIEVSPSIPAGAIDTYIKKGQIHQMQKERRKRQCRIASITAVVIVLVLTATLLGVYLGGGSKGDEQHPNDITSAGTDTAAGIEASDMSNVEVPKGPAAATPVVYEDGVPNQNPDVVTGADASNEDADEDTDESSTGSTTTTTTTAAATTKTQNRRKPVTPVVYDQLPVDVP